MKKRWFINSKILLSVFPLALATTSCSMNSIHEDLIEVDNDSNDDNNKIIIM